MSFWNNRDSNFRNSIDDISVKCSYKVQNIGDHTKLGFLTLQTRVLINLEFTSFIDEM